MEMKRIEYCKKCLNRKKDDLAICRHCGSRENAVKCTNCNDKLVKEVSDLYCEECSPLTDFKTFKLKFLTKEETLDQSSFRDIGSIKRYILQECKVRFGNQKILFQGAEQKNVTKLSDIYLKKLQIPAIADKELCLNMLIIRRPFQVEVHMKISEYNQTYGTYIKVSDQNTIADLKRKIKTQVLYSPPFDYMYIENKDGVELADDKTFEDYGIYEAGSELVLKQRTSVRLYFEESGDTIERVIIIEGEYLRKTIGDIMIEYQKEFPGKDIDFNKDDWSFTGDEMLYGLRNLKLFQLYNLSFIVRESKSKSCILM